MLKCSLCSLFLHNLSAYSRFVCLVHSIVRICRLNMEDLILLACSVLRLRGKRSPLGGRAPNSVWRSLWFCKPQTPMLFDAPAMRPPFGRGGRGPVLVAHGPKHRHRPRFTNCRRSAALPRPSDPCPAPYPQSPPHRICPHSGTQNPHSGLSPGSPSQR